jgi:hypothetical protein
VTLYLAVTADKYELPLYVADTRKEMAEWYGVSGDWITTAMCNYRRIWGNNPHERKHNHPDKVLFMRLEVDD